MMQVRGNQDVGGDVRRSALTPFENRSFRLQFGAFASSMVGNMMSPVAIAFGVMEKTGSIESLGLVLAASALPLVVLLPVAGVWGDRIPRHHVMFGSDILRALIQMSLGLVLLLGQSPLIAIVLLQFLFGACSAFFYPASAGLTPLTVRTEQLQQANAILSFSRSTAGIIGALASSIVVAEVGAGWVLLLDALTFVISAGFILGIRLERRSDSVDKPSFLQELRDGFHEVRSQSWIWASILCFAVSQLALSAFLVLGPAHFSLSREGPMGWGAIVAAISVGQLIGDILALRLFPARLLVVARLIELLLVPILGLVSIDAPITILVIAAAIGGIAITYPDVLWYTALQQNLPERSMARVSSYDWMGSLVLHPIGYASAAAVASKIGITTTLVTVAILIVISRIGSLLLPGIRSVRRIDEEVSQKIPADSSRTE